MSEITEIEGLLKRGEIEEALEFVEYHIDNPNLLARELIFKGNRLAEIREYELSIKYLDFSSRIANDEEVIGYALSCSALERSLKKVESITFFNLALSFQNLGKIDDAIENYNKAIFIESDLTMAYINRGTAYYSKEMYDEALEDYNKAIDLDPENASTYNNRGSVYFDMKIYDRALEDLNRAIELDSEDPQLYNNRAQVYLDLNRYEDAVKDYDAIMRIDPDFEGAIRNREVAYEKFRGVLEGTSLKIDINGLDVGKDDIVSLKDQDYNGEIRYRKAIYSHIDLEESHNGLGVVLSRRGAYKEAINEFKSAIELSEKNIYYSNLGCAQADYGKGTALAPFLIYKARKNLVKAIKDDVTYLNGFRNLSLADMLLRRELKLFSVRFTVLLSIFTILMLSLPYATAQIVIGTVAIGTVLFNLHFSGPEIEFRYDDQREV